MTKIDETLDECLMLPEPLLDGQQSMHNGLEQVLLDKGNQQVQDEGDRPFGNTHTWSEVDFEEILFEEEVTLDETKNDLNAWNLGENMVGFEQRIEHVSRNSLIFDPGGDVKQNDVLEWATNLWPFDPGGWHVFDVYC